MENGRVIKSNAFPPMPNVIPFDKADADSLPKEFILNRQTNAGAAQSW